MNFNFKNCFNCNSASLLPHTSKFYLWQLLLQLKHLFFWCKKMPNLKIPSSFNTFEGKDSAANLVNIPHKKTFFYLQGSTCRKWNEFLMWGFISDVCMINLCYFDVFAFQISPDSYLQRTRSNSLYPPRFHLAFYYWNKPQNRWHFLAMACAYWLAVQKPLEKVSAMLNVFYFSITVIQSRKWSQLN